MKSKGIWCTTGPLLLLGLCLLWAGIRAYTEPVSGALPPQPGEELAWLKLILLSCVTLFSGLCMACLGLSSEARCF